MTAITTSGAPKNSTLQATAGSVKPKPAVRSWDAARCSLVGTGEVDVTYHTEGLVAAMRAPLVEVQRL